MYNNPVNFIMGNDPVDIQAWLPCIFGNASPFFSFVPMLLLLLMLVLLPSFVDVGFAQTLKHTIGHYLLSIFKHETEMFTLCM